MRVLSGDAGPLFRAGLVSGSGEGSFAPGRRMPGEGVLLKGDVEDGDVSVEASALLRFASSLPLRAALGGGVCCDMSIRSSRERELLLWSELGLSRAGVFGDGLSMAFGARGGDAVAGA